MVLRMLCGLHVLLHSCWCCVVIMLYFTTAGVVWYSCFTAQLLVLCCNTMVLNNLFGHHAKLHICCCCVVIMMCYTTPGVVWSSCVTGQLLVLCGHIMVLQKLCGRHVLLDSCWCCAVILWYCKNCVVIMGNCTAAGVVWSSWCATQLMVVQQLVVCGHIKTLHSFRCCLVSIWYFLATYTL